jgi:NAD(P)-dependent dehydrogenase (short-subunit alcohol dehydrogenase family)
MFKAPVSGPVDLRGQTAIVTGAATGLGRAICKALAREGANIVACWHLTPIEQTMNDIRQFNVRAIDVRVDVTNKDEVKRMVNKAIEEFGQIHILVNNAGVISVSTFEDETIEEWKRMLDVNLLGYFLCTQAVFSHMKKYGYGKIVCIGSIAGEVGSLLSASSYSASKGAVHAFAKTVAKLGAKYGIYCNVVAPGVVRTRMTEGMGHREDISLLRRKAEPEDVAEAVVFLASQASNYITGAVLYVDGGFIIS